MTTTVSVDYGAGASALTITLASLASSSTLTVGREATAIDNTSTKALDYIVEAQITTGTSPTADRQIEIWVAASVDGTNYSGAATGSNAGLTPTEKTTMGLGRIIPTSNVSDTAYRVVFSVCEALNVRYCPAYVTFWVTQNTGQNLNSTAGNHFIKATPIKVVGA